MRFVMICPGKRGFALVLVTGILAFLAVFALFFHAAARMTFDAAHVAGGAGRAGLSAASGLEYAVARLVREPYPFESLDPTRRGDSWLSRDPAGTPLERTLNPSFSHGEPWTEGGAADGRYDPAIDSLGADLDGDERFSARSGRLRGDSASFLLRAVSIAGKVPLNAGNGAQGNGGGLHPFNIGLAHVLNNLGAVVLPAGHPRRRSIATSGEPIVYSFLGNDLVGNRPATGYRDLAHLAEVMAGLGGGAWYPPASGGPWGLADCLPFVSAGPPVAAVQFGPPHLSEETHVPSAPVEWACAPREVLESLWRYMTFDPCICFWDPSSGATATIDPRSGTGGDTSGGAVPYGASRLILFPDEAGRLADEAILLRRQAGPHLSWNAIYERFLERAGEIFTDGLAACPAERALYLAAKADLAFAVVSPDPHPHATLPGYAWSAMPLAWSGWGIARDDGLGGLRPFPTQVRWTAIARIRLPPPAYVDPSEPFKLRGSPLVPLALTTRPPVRFEVASLGTVRERGGHASIRLDGDLATGEHLFFGSQEDFENLAGAPELARGLAIRATNDAPWADHPADTRRRGIARDDPSAPADPSANRDYRRIASLPRWDLGSLPAGVVPSPPGFSRLYGALALAGGEDGVRGADLYWPFGESLDGLPVEFSSESSLPIAPIPWRGRMDISDLDTVPMDPNGSSVNPTSTPYLVSADGEGRSPPVFLGESVNPPMGCPGTFADQPIRDLTLEGWATSVPPSKVPTAILGLYGYRGSEDALDGYPLCSLEIFATERLFPVPAVDYFVRAYWMSAPGSNTADRKFVSTPSVVVDSLAPHHLRVAVKRLSPVATAVALLVDGVPAGEPGIFPGEMFGQNHETIAIHGMDDLRIYSTPQPAARAREAWERGRFARSGEYKSPLYVPDASVRLRGAQWTGMTPLDWPEGTQPITVTVIAYPNADGSGVPTTHVLGKSGETADLAILGTARSFRYVVSMEVPAAVRPILDTPVFESIWFTFQRPGRTPAWTSWAGD